MESRGGRNRNVENTHCVVLRIGTRGANSYWRKNGQGTADYKSTVNDGPTNRPDLVFTKEEQIREDKSDDPSAPAVVEEVLTDKKRTRQVFRDFGGKVIDTCLFWTCFCFPRISANDTRDPQILRF